MIVRLYISILLSLYNVAAYELEKDDDSNNSNPSTDGNDDDIDDTEDNSDDECTYLSGQHCGEDGICKYCAMCIDSSCIKGKDECSTGALYPWYGYCLSSGNDSSGDYCATSTQCYQYRQSSVTFAWHNLTCNPFNCMLVGQPIILSQNTTIQHGQTNITQTQPEPQQPHRRHPIATTTLIALCTFISFCLAAFSVACFLKQRVKKINKNTPSSIPSTAPPSFSQISRQTSTSESLPSYKSSILPPKYEQAIVTQIRSSESCESSIHDEHQVPAPSSSSSTWMPVYFTRPSHIFRSNNHHTTSNNHQ